MGVLTIRALLWGVYIRALILGNSHIQTKRNSTKPKRNDTGRPRYKQVVRMQKWYGMFLRSIPVTIPHGTNLAHGVHAVII